MAIDLFHVIGSDLSILSNGQFELASGAVCGQQFVLRRLLTNPKAHRWSLEYGAGLALFLGKPMSEPRIKAVISTQMLKEQAVQQSPAPTIDVSASTSNVVAASIKYVDTDEGTTSLLEFDTDGMF